MQNSLRNSQGKKEQGEWSSKFLSCGKKGHELQGWQRGEVGAGMPPPSSYPPPFLPLILSLIPA
ncbi:hypothetical protein TIFTF001_010771 [Ficus carica]|uniref:Uncharacterized protein n=1 Tax=Ficus carica TaxID=3494 RepID=A0AA88D4R6_FICCA|nr:hypothetical protein TIFTF001_010771 [Ficus carica]